MTDRRSSNRRRPEWVQQLEQRQLFANLGELGIYLVDHATRQRVASPYAGQEVEIHASFVADAITPGSIVRVQRETANGVLYTEMAAPESWRGHFSVDRNLFTWTVPPKNARVTVTLDPRGVVAESDESDNSFTLTLSPRAQEMNLGVPAYHSLPGAAHALYLDFDGNYQAQFAGSTDVTTPAYDSDGNPSVLSAKERDEIRQIWARVAEDYSPFNIDVTTEPPRDGQYTRWQRVAIGGASCDWYQFSAAGTAMVGSFADTGGASAAFVFTEQANGDGSAFRYPVTTIADAASHEAGHTFGLMHQARFDADGNLTNAYNPGDGTWGPLMGKSGNPISTWYNGPTDESATSYQDDMAILAGAANGFGYRADDAGNDIVTAKALGTFTWSLGTGGVIGTNDDVDVYSAELPGGIYHIAADVTADGPNLDAVLEVRDANGAFVALSDPSDRQSASIDLTLTAGTYYLLVRSTGVYGWVGQYNLSVRPPVPPAQPGPVPTPPLASGPAVDLATGITSKPPKSVTVGTKSTASVIVKNIGNLRSTVPVTVKVYASTTRGLTASGVLLGRTVVRSPLAIGGRQTVLVPLTYAKGMKGGNYFLVATVSSSAAESSATNNVAASASRVQVVAPTVRLTGAVARPHKALSQKAWTAQVAVKNEGNGAFSGRAAVTVYASADGIFGDDDDVLVGTANVSMALGAGAVRTVMVPSHPVGTAGTYSLFAVVTRADGIEPVTAKKAVRARFA